MTTLTADEVAQVRSTWAKVQGSGTAADIGRNVFIKFFELDPSAQKEFPFKDESLAQLKSNVLLAQHGAKFIEYITTAVNGLDDYAGKAHGPLTELGTRHRTRGTTPANMAKIVEAMLFVFGKGAGDDFAAANEGWSKVCAQISTTVLEGMK